MLPQTPERFYHGSRNISACYFICNILYCALGALASSPDPTVVLEVLNFLLTPEVSCVHSCLLEPQRITFLHFFLYFFMIFIIQVRNQDVVYGLGEISIEGRDVAWTWLKV